MAVALAAFAIAILVAHVPPVRAMALRRIGVFARAHLGTALTASSLHYNLARRTVELRDVTLAGVETPDTPFLTVPRVRARLGWRALAGHLDADSVVIDAPRLIVRRQGDGHTNLPVTTSGDASGALPAFVIRNVTVSDLGLRVDTGSDTDALTIDGATIELSGSRERWLEGRIVAARGISLAGNGARVQIDPTEARVTFDGQAVTVTSLDGTAAGGPLHAEGRLAVIGGPRRIDLSLSWTPDAAGVSAWMPTAERVAGRVAIRAKVTGAFEHPEVAIETDGHDLVWRGVRATTVRATATLSDRALTLDALDAAMETGTLQASGRIVLGATQPAAIGAAANGDRAAAGDAVSGIRARWNDLDMYPLARAFQVTLPRAARFASSGQADLSWRATTPSLPQLSGTLDASVRGLAGGAAGTGVLTARGTDGRWSISADHSLEDGTRASGTIDLALDAQAWRRSQLAGTMAIATSNLDAAIARLRQVGVPMPSMPDVHLRGPARVEATLTGTLDDPRARGQAVIEGIGTAALGEMRARADFVADRRTLAVDPLIVDVAGASAEARGSIGVTSAAGEGTLRIDIADLSSAFAGVADPWRPGGALTATGNWTGTLRAPAIEMEVSGHDLSVAATAVDRVSGSVRYEGGALTFRHVELTQGADGVLRVDGQVRPDGTGLALDLQGRGLGVGWASGAAGNDAGDSVRFDDMTIAANLDGSIAVPRGRATLSAGHVRWRGRDAGPLDGTVTAGDGTALVRASLPELGLGIAGDIGESAPHAFSARVTADHADIARVLDVLGLAGSIGVDTDGNVSARADVSGPAFTLADTAARIDITQLSGRLLGVPMTLVDTAQVEIDATRVRTTPARLTVGGLTVGVHGETGNTPSALVATIDGPLEAAVPLLARLDPDHEWSGTGTVAARVEVRGPPAGAAITGTVSASAGTVLRDGVQVARELVVEGRLTGDRLEVTDVRGAVLGATVVGHGDAPAAWVTSWLPRSDRTSAPTAAAPATFSARAEVDVDGLFAGLGRLRPPTLHGQLTLALQAQASEPSLDAIRGEVVAERGRISIVEQEELAQVRPTRLVLDAGTLTVDTFDWKSQQAHVTARGVVGLRTATTTDLTLTSDSTLRLADMLIPGRTTGRARTNLRVTGPAGAPQVSGDVVIEDASLLLPGARFALAGWSGTLALSDRGLDVRGLRGQFNGGDISVEGTARHRAVGLPGRHARDHRARHLSRRPERTPQRGGCRSHAGPEG